MTLPLPFEPRRPVRSRRVTAWPRALVALLLGVGAVTPACAGPYTLRQAYEEAQARHPSVAVSIAERAAAGHALESAKWARYPSLTTEVARGNSSGGDVGVVRIDQPLWTGGRISGQIEGAQAQQAAAVEGESEARRAMAEQVAVTYLGWLGAEARLAIAVDGRAVFERLLATVRRREAAGAAAQSDVSIALGRYAAAAAQREQLAAELERTRAELQALVVGNLGTPVDVSVAAPVAAQADVMETLYLAVSPTMARRRAEQEAAQAAWRVASAATWPTVGVRLQQQRGFGGAVVDSSASLQLTLQYAPGAGLGAVSAADAALSRVHAAAEQVRVAEIDTRLRARAHWLEHESARRQIVELRPQIDALQSTADSYLRQFDAGRRGWIDVLNVYREALDARIALSRLETLRAQSALRMMANTGELLPWIHNSSP